MTADTSVILAVWFAAALLAYTIKGFSGFGPALVVVPTLSVLYSPRTALGTSAVIDFVVGIGFLVFLGLDRTHVRLLLRMTGPLVVGTIVGSFAVTLVPRKALLALVGLSVLGLAFGMLRTGRPSVTGPGKSMPLQLSCLLAGLSGGLVGVSGPFIVAGTARFDKSEMRRLLVAVFLVEGIVKIAVYGFTGTINAQSLGLASAAGPAIVCGMVAGVWLHKRVSQEQFIKIIGWLLVIIALQPIAMSLA